MMALWIDLEFLGKFGLHYVVLRHSCSRCAYVGSWTLYENG